MAEDGSVVAVGETYGSWDGLNAGFDDFAAVRLDASGDEIWRYQVNLTLKCYLLARMAATFALHCQRSIY